MDPKRKRADLDRSSSSSVAVAVRDLVKRYRPPAALRRQAARLQGRVLPASTLAIDGLDFEAKRGEVYGILGPNGAGKTTLMKVVGTILLPDAGSVEVLGHDATRDAERLRGRIGIVLGEYERTFHWRLTGRQNLHFFAAFYGISKRDAEERIDLVLEQVGLTEQADSMFNAYSTGMKHRLALARGLLPDPELLLLDEPTAGLDPVSSSQVAELVRARAAAGTTVLYTTHRLHEAGNLCDRILVLERGRRVADATPEELVRLAKGSQVVEAQKRGGGPWERSLIEPLARLSGVLDWETRGDKLLLFTVNDDEVVTRVVGALRKERHDKVAVTVRSPDVEDAFRTLIERARQDAASKNRKEDA